MDFDFGALSRHPDVEAPELVAADAADRLLLDEAAEALAAAPPETVAVIGDAYGALTLGAVARHGVRGIRVHQDALSGEHALAANAGRLGIAQDWRSHDLDATLLAGATLVLLRLPRSLDALSEIVEAITRYAAPDVRVFAGGMVKHMAVSMNDVMRAGFGRLDVTHARQKARVLIAAKPLPGAAQTWPKTRTDAATGLTVVARGAAFAGATVDIGTRFLLEHLDGAPDVDEAIDLGCGTGVIAAWLARARPGLRVVGTDQSAAAVASARATAAANGVADRVEVVRDDALSSRPDDSARLIVLNPPFHIGATVHRGIALKLFADAGRVLAPGGELWAVWNAHLKYRPDLERLVGPTRQIARDRTFTITASTAR
ncbi:class I SAM-dependent methyltransferase [Microbacterium sp. SS28]|uniref:class I SAM-dependent methyltransferase n=1 Tax=Microbacterium sp. SS28 TaxID=2919948 RepID=UPI001FA9B07E|nr:methyltransferase [Microbacterium sp. SS28]